MLPDCLCPLQLTVELNRPRLEKLPCAEQIDILAGPSGAGESLASSLEGKGAEWRRS